MIGDYINYFRDLCSHSASLIASGSDPAFEVSSIEEAFGDFNHNIPISGMYFRLILPTINTEYAGDDRYIDNAEGGFEIGKMYMAGDSASKISALQDSEDVCRVFIARMMRDSRLGVSGGFIARGFNGVNVIQLRPMLATGDTSYAGMLVLFPMQISSEYCSSNPDWTDL